MYKAGEIMWLDDENFFNDFDKEENDYMYYVCFDCGYISASKNEFVLCPECGSHDLDCYSVDEFIEHINYDPYA